MFKSLICCQDLAVAVPKSDLLSASSSLIPHDCLMGLLVPVHHLNILLQFCASELRFGLESPSWRVNEKATDWVNESCGACKEYRDCAGINNPSAVCQNLEIERLQKIEEGESCRVLSAIRGESQINHFGRTLLYQIRGKIPETTHSLLIDIGMKVDDQGSIVFKCRIHVLDFLSDVDFKVQTLVNSRRFG